MVLLPQSLHQLLPQGQVIHIGRLTPVRETLVVAADPLDGPLLEQRVILPRALFDPTQIDRCLVPRLAKNGDCEVSFRSEMGVILFNFGGVRIPRPES